MNVFILCYLITTLITYTIIISSAENTFTIREDKPLRFLLLGDWGKGGTTGVYGSSMDDDTLTDLPNQTLSVQEANNASFLANNNQGGNKGGNGNNKNQKVLYQMAVAKSMGSFSTNAVPAPSFVLALGDNFYSNGVSSATDSLWNYLWKDVYLTYPALNIPWYPVFGNHDYGGGATAVQAQIDRYHAHTDDDIWMFESTNYTRRFSIPGDQGASVMIVFIDTTTLAPSLNKCCNENG